MCYHRVPTVQRSKRASRCGSSVTVPGLLRLATTATAQQPDSINGNAVLAIAVSVAGRYVEWPGRRWLAAGGGEGRKSAGAAQGLRTFWNGRLAAACLRIRTRGWAESTPRLEPSLSGLAHSHLKGNQHTDHRQLTISPQAHMDASAIFCSTCGLRGTPWTIVHLTVPVRRRSPGASALHDRRRVPRGTSWSSSIITPWPGTVHRTRTAVLRRPHHSPRQSTSNETTDMTRAS